MLSICIPIYNFDVRATVSELHLQAAGLNIPIEIVCIDDHSDPAFDTLNREIEPLTTHYIRLDENIGRARIRNLFLQYTRYDYLLFLDCDALIESRMFLSRYTDVLAVKPSVVCGGHQYPNSCDRQHRLRHTYGVRCEAKNANQRQQRPNRSFMTSNFIIRRRLFESIRFDEALSQYGHEDTLLGHELNEQRITILHIQNPITIGYVDTNTEFIRKTKESIGNLAYIYRSLPKESTITQEVTLLKAYTTLKQSHTVPVIQLATALLNPLLERLFLGGFANMILFKFYKLGLLITELNNNNK